MTLCEAGGADKKLDFLRGSKGAELECTRKIKSMLLYKYIISADEPGVRTKSWI